MKNNILSKHSKNNDNFADFSSLFNTERINNIQQNLDSSIDRGKAKTAVDNIVSNTANSQTDSEAVAISNPNSLNTGNGKDTIVGAANIVVSSNAIADAQSKSVSQSTSEYKFLGSAVSESDAVIEALAIGIENTGQIVMGKGSDTIVGTANVSATAIAQASSQAELVAFDYVSEAKINAQSEATVEVVADGVGISNLGKIHTGKGHDTIIGIANVSATATSSAFSQGNSVSGNHSVAIAKSESDSVIDALAIGIENASKIATGQGDDVVIGLANTSTMTEADAEAFADNVATLSPELDRDAFDRVEAAISQSTSVAIAASFTTTLGIINSENIFTGQGNDVVFGLANNESISNSEAIAEAVAVGRDLANAEADSRSLAVANGSAVGIANLGKIYTGKGHDTIVGVAVNNSAAVANADSEAVAVADVSDSRANTDVVADTSGAIAIGIDNADGEIETGSGNDRIIGYGGVGIIGGNIHTGKGDDRVIGYGITVGVEGGVTKLGKGNDHFKADIVDFDPFTGKVWFQDDRSSSIKNAEVFGGHGNDTFELGGFEGSVLIDGGKHHDVLKLWGSVDDYKFTLGSSGNELTVEDSDSKLFVKNVEAVYFDYSDRAYSFNDFA